MMNRIIMHHTGGTYTPNNTDRRAYHQITDGDGRTHQGQFPIEANAPGRIVRGQYAAHCFRLNSGSIGASMACMGGGQWNNPRGGRWFPTNAQIDGFLRNCAQVARQWSIQIDRRTLLSHAEVEPTLGVAQRAKWDFDYPLGFVKTQTRDPVAIGDELRQEIASLARGIPSSRPPAQPVARPMLRQGDRGDHVRHLQQRLGIAVDGAFGPATRAAVVKLQRQNQLLPDGIVGPMTWAALK